MSTPTDPALEAVCAACGVGIDLNDCGHRVCQELPVAEAPDGLPAVVLEAICKACEALEFHL